MCGCDGVTYGNSCEAAGAGVRIALDGACPGSTCWSSEECSQRYYCATDQSAPCVGFGTCEARPAACPDIDDPVCGCDGVTYGNACEAAAAAMSIDCEGSCPCGP